ncbi:hypothetical protein T11_502 [Trichinella zimbabwensis]|uniref:Uncharacterized protein n=1 Tax=Trichinella zimbabwensis TaxID=268475 RepID=A0A0V1H1A2_9BILA|nr:hypothetical protein T11_502 [Trichinella zimbabwensis]
MNDSDKHNKTFNSIFHLFHILVLIISLCYFLCLCISKIQRNLIHKWRCYTLKCTNHNDKYWFTNPHVTLYLPRRQQLFSWNIGQGQTSENNQCRCASFYNYCCMFRCSAHNIVVGWFPLQFYEIILCRFSRNGEDFNS